MGSDSGGGGSLSAGGGLNRSNSKNKFTYLGDIDPETNQAGWGNGPLGALGQNEYDASVQNRQLANYLLGGPGYGQKNAPMQNPPPSTGTDPSQPGDGDAAPMTPSGQRYSPQIAKGAGDSPNKLPWGSGDQWQGGGNNQTDDEADRPGGGPSTYSGAWSGANPAFQNPNGGLVGAFQDIYSNPETDKDREVQGMYDWWASGAPTAGEKDVAGRYTNIANDPASALEKQTSAGYQGFANGPNARDQALYGAMGTYGGSQGKYDPLMGDTYSKMVTSGGYTPQQQTDMMVAGQQAARAGYDAAAGQMARTAAATNNQAGLYGAQARMARDQANTMADTARQTRMAAANEQIRQREAGAAGLAGVQAGLDTRQRYGLSGQAELANQANQNALAGLGGNAAMGANQEARRMASLGQMNSMLQNLRGYQMAGTQGAQQQQNELFNRRMQGLGGLAGLYQSAVGQQNTNQGQLADLLGKPRELYNEGGGANGGLSL